METIRCSFYLPTGATIITDVDREWRILPNFRLWELANNEATDEQTVDGIRFATDSMYSWKFLTMLQITRDHFGAITLGSGYRTQAFNDSLKKATHDSQHCHMQAADPLREAKYRNVDPWINFWRNLCYSFHEVGAIGLYDDIYHLEIGSDRRYGAKGFDVRDYR